MLEPPRRDPLLVATKNFRFDLNHTSKPTAIKLPLDPSPFPTTKGALSGAFCRLLSRIRENQRITLAMVYATMVETLTPIRPGIMKLWLSRYLPMRVVPVRSKFMAARSLG